MRTNPVESSALESLLEQARTLHDSFETKGAAETLLPLFRKQNRKALRALINDALGELKDQPDVLARVAARTASKRGEAPDWTETAAEVKDLLSDGEDRLKEKRENVLRRAEWVKSQIEAAARGKAKPDEVASAVRDLLGEFSPAAAAAARPEATIAEQVVDVTGVLRKQYDEGRAAIEEMARKASQDLGEVWDDAKKGRLDPNEIHERVQESLEAARAVVPEDPHAPPHVATSETGPVDAPRMDVMAPAAAAAALEKKPMAGPTLEPARILSAADVSVAATISAPSTPASRFPNRCAGAPGLLSDRFLEKRIRAVIGRETPLFRTNVLLAALVRYFACDRVGALHVTCTDEAEQDSRVRFARSGVGLMLPALSEGRGSAVVTSNRGGCYEPGSLSIAARHFDGGGTLALIARLQSHCGVMEKEGRRVYGCMDRYGRESHCCGALRAVLEGDHAIPRIADVAATLSGRDLDEIRGCGEAARPLLVAVLQARTQVERALAEARTLAFEGVAVFFGSVHLNGLSDPSEIPVVLSVIDRRGGESASWEIGLSSAIASLTVEESREGTVVASKTLT